MNKNFEQQNKDALLDDIKVLWNGQNVLLTLDGKVLTVLRATTHVRENIENWCMKNSYRCTQIHDGKIWL